MEIFFITLPVFFIIFAGWLLRKYKIVRSDWIHILNQYAYYVALPALIVANLWTIDFTGHSARLAVYYGIGLMVLFSALILAGLSFARVKTGAKVAIFLAATTGNTIYMAYPVAEMVYGKDILAQTTLIGVIFLVLPILLSIFVIRYWHDKNHRIGEQLIAFLKNPLFIATVLGVCLSFVKADFQILVSVKKTLSMLAATASPAALFALGGFLRGKFLRTNLKEVFAVSLLKLAAFPAFVFMFLRTFMKSGDVEFYMLLASMPVAITTFIVAEEFNLEKELVGNAILISTILSFFVIPAIIYLF